MATSITTTKLLPIGEFVRQLRTLPEQAFDDIDAMETWMKHRPVDPESLAPHVIWDRQHYTRNLVDHTEMYDLIAICWETGQGSSIHSHKGQHCWMSVPLGRLAVQNYRVLVEDVERQYCEIEPTERFEIHSGKPTAVQPDTPVHEVINPREFGERAVSLHVYSRPFNRCTVYSMEKRTCGEIELHFTSIYGKPSVVGGQSSVVSVG